MYSSQDIAVFNNLIIIIDYLPAQGIKIAPGYRQTCTFLGYLLKGCHLLSCEQRSQVKRKKEKTNKQTKKKTNTLLSTEMLVSVS